MKTPQYKTPLVFVFALALLSACNGGVGGAPAPGPSPAPSASTIQPQAAKTYQSYDETLDADIFQLSWQMDLAGDFTVLIDLCQEIESEGEVCDPFYEIKKSSTVEIYDVFLTQDGAIKNQRTDDSASFVGTTIAVEGKSIVSYTLADKFYAGDVKSVFRMKILAGGLESEFIYINK
ncbi:hypothetical protein GW916_00610 [bacterium]|nr:hypothetical protein [bacterium]